MPKLTHTTVITPVYPDPYFIERGVFVEQMVREWINTGIKVDVVAPRSWANRIRGGFRKMRQEHEIAGSRILYPNYLTLSNNSVAGLNFKKFSYNRFVSAALSSSGRISKPQLYYGKFLMTGGLAALQAAKRYGVPAIADMGENLWELKKSSPSLLKHLVCTLDGITCVSDELKEALIEWGADPQKIYSHPNTVDLSRFMPLSKVECRKKLGLPLDIPILIFVGYFTKNKGIHHVIRTLNELSATGVKGIFIGRGPIKPKGENVLYAGPVSNSNIPYWLNAADLFILPTTREGNCNAINEAMACALPVISSDITSVRGQIDDKSGVLIPPGRQAEITQNVQNLINDAGLRQELGKNARKKIEGLQGESRALKISKWLERFI